MKAISTFITLFLIITAFVASEFLYLDENYGLSAVLSIMWFLSLTLWIDEAAGLMNIVNNRKPGSQNA